MDFKTWFLLLCVITMTNAATWSYTGANGATKWNTAYPQYCGGNEQSPIDIKEDDTKYDGDLGDLTISSTLLGNGTLKNSGYSVGFTSEQSFDLSGGGLTGTYKFYQFHFHWGSDSSKGSEHTLGGAAFPLEVHVIFTNSKYSDVMEALNKTDGLAVFGTFYEIGAENAAVKALQTQFTTIQNAVVNTTLDLSYKLTDFMSSDRTKYFRYSGSLTTPNCNEVVTWTVFKEYLTVTEAQMDEFRKLKDTNSTIIVDNYRPVQDLEGRTIKNSYSSATSVVSSITLFYFLFSVYFFVN